MCLTLSEIGPEISGTSLSPWALAMRGLSCWNCPVDSFQADTSLMISSQKDSKKFPNEDPEGSGSCQISSPEHPRVPTFVSSSNKRQLAMIPATMRVSDVYRPRGDRGPRRGLPSTQGCSLCKPESLRWESSSLPRHTTSHPSLPSGEPGHLHLQPAEPQLATLEAEGGGSGFLPSRRGPSLKGTGWSQASSAQAGWLLAVAQCFCGRRTETDMEQGKRLAGLILAIFLLQGTIVQSQKGNDLVTVDDNQEDGSVLLICNLEGKDIKWFKDGKEITTTNEKTWSLGSSLKDPQGTYSCQGSVNKSKSLQVYYRMCQNCIELNASTMSGFVFAEIFSVFFLAVGVYFIAGQDGVRQSRASDKQTLLSNDQLYQPLKDREDDQYSHLQGNQLRRN